MKFKILFKLLAGIIFFHSLAFAQNLEAALHVLTVASDVNQPLFQLIDSAKRQKLDLAIMGLHLPYPGNTQKLYYLDRYLEKVPDEDVILFVDAYDVLILGGEKALMEKFLSFQAPIVISAERNCYPDPTLSPLFPKSPTSFCHLCSGTIMGYAGAIRKVLNDLKPFKVKESDQLTLSLYYLGHKDQIKLDYYCDLFFAMHNVRWNEIELDIAARTVLCKETGRKPLVVHGNGNGKSHYQGMYDLMFKNWLYKF